MAPSPPASPSSVARPTSKAHSTRDLTTTTTTATTPIDVEEPTATTTTTIIRWTSEQEIRLKYCQDQLKQAQRKWSDRQELWIREVDHLLDLKRAHAKAQKKAKARAGKASRKTSKLWRPLSRTHSSSVVDTAAGMDGVDDKGEVDGQGEVEDEEGEEGGEEEEEEEEEEEQEGVGGEERSKSLPWQRHSLSSSSSPTTPSLPTTTTTTTPTTGGFNPFKNIIRRMSSASFRGNR